MSRLIDDMLELGRLEMVEALALRPINLLALVEDVVVQTASSAAQRDMSVELAADSALPLVRGNADRLRQVFLNLLDNALKYAGDGARVMVTLEPKDGSVACAVCDTGPGIPPEHLPLVTQRFYRAAPEAVEGSGLGLALVKGILRLHGSDLTVVSPVAEGRGTCVTFDLAVTGE